MNRIQHRFAYLPTWEGPSESMNYSSVAIADRIVAAITAIGGTVQIKLHPSTGSRLVEQHALEKSEAFSALRSHAVHIFPRTYSANHLMAESDFCVTDVSSVVSDWILRDKPLFAYRPRSKGRTAQGRYDLRDYCYTFETAEELSADLQRVILSGDDYKRQFRREVSEYLVSREASLSNEFAVQLRHACSLRPAPAGAESPSPE